MKLGVVTFPGSNCDHDLIYVLRDLMQASVTHLWHKDHDLQGVDMVFLPGGFSYGDYLRSGAIARFSPIMEAVQQHAAKGGYVVGICNGFQILTEAGLLPGALLRNVGTRFICDHVFIKKASNTARISRELSRNKAYSIPIAHADGNYFADDDTLKQLQDNDSIIFQYCDAQGRVVPEANPNGSALNIAGVSNVKHNVFGLMPHPERAADSYLGNLDGLEILKGLVR